MTPRGLNITVEYFKALLRPLLPAEADFAALDQIVETYVRHVGCLATAELPDAGLNYELKYISGFIL